MTTRQIEVGQDNMAHDQVENCGACLDDDDCCSFDPNGFMDDNDDRSSLSFQDAMSKLMKSTSNGYQFDWRSDQHQLPQDVVGLERAVVSPLQHNLQGVDGSLSESDDEDMDMSENELPPLFATDGEQFESLVEEELLGNNHGSAITREETATSFDVDTMMEGLENGVELEDFVAAATEIEKLVDDATHVAPVEDGASSLDEASMNDHESLSVEDIQERIIVAMLKKCYDEELACQYLHSDSVKRTTVHSWAAAYLESHPLIYKNHHLVLETLLFFLQRFDESVTRVDMLKILLRVESDGENTVKFETSKARAGAPYFLRDAIKNMAEALKKIVAKSKMTEKYLKRTAKHSGTFAVSLQLLYVHLLLCYDEDMTVVHGHSWSEQVPQRWNLDSVFKLILQTKRTRLEISIVFLYAMMLVCPETKSRCRDWRNGFYCMLSDNSDADSLYNELVYHKRIERNDNGIFDKFVKAISQGKTAEKIGVKSKEEAYSLHFPLGDPGEFWKQTELSCYLLKQTLETIENERYTNREWRANNVPRSAERDRERDDGN